MVLTYFLLFSIFAVFIFFYFLLSRNRNYWKCKGVPYEKPAFIFGNFSSVGKEHMADTMRAIYTKHKTPYVGIHVFTKPFLMLRSPELVKKVLVKDSDKFLNRNFTAYEDIDPIAYHALFSAHDAAWKNSRTKLSPVFTSGKMKLMFPLIKECAGDLKDYLLRNNGKTVTIRDMTKRYSVDVISSCAFGINAYCLKKDDAEIMNVAKQLFDFHSLKRNFISLCYFFFPLLVRVFKFTFLDKEAMDYLQNMFKNTAEIRKKQQIIRNDLIDLLGPTDLDDPRTAAQAITFFSAGNDTTSIMMMFTLYELAVHKDVQDRLREEIKQSFEDNGDFTYESIQSLKYLDMVFNEALRKYPLTTFLDRVSREEYTFEETGLTVAKGTAIMIPVCGLHFDPEYFPDPEQFDPERFNEENKKNIKPYTFLPFGEGPRICIGQRFAYLVAKIGLAYALKDFIFEPAETTKIPLQFDNSTTFLIDRHGVPLKVTKI